jgi:hypothetical protein
MTTDDDDLDQARTRALAKLDEYEAETRRILDDPDTPAGTRQHAKSTLKKILAERKEITG